MIPDKLGFFIVPIYTYGILMGIAFLLGLGYLYFNLKKTSNSTEIFLDAAITLTFSSIFGARLLYILLYSNEFETFKDYLALHEGGMVFFGGFLGALTGLVLLLKFKEKSIIEFADAISGPLTLGHAIGRLGCYTNGCCYGKITSQLSIYHLSSDPEGIFRHPTQLYSSAFLFLLSIVLWFSFKKTYIQKQTFKGLTSGIYLLAYTFFRFLIEFLRGDDRGGFFTSFHLSISQVLSLIIMVISIIWLYKNYSKHNQGEK
jgi:phosphatidylglycerol:prolipoprotein diacylglycerol transferase